MTADAALEAAPERLRGFVRSLGLLPDRSDRIHFLIDVAERFQEIPPDLASRPYPEERLVPHCESEAYFFPEENADGTFRFRFAVENPQGISAKAMAVILDETLSGAPLHEVAAVPGDLGDQIFGRELSMGKSMGLGGMVTLVKRSATQRLAGQTLSGA